MSKQAPETSCPTVPNPYRGTAGQCKEDGTGSGTDSGTGSLKALAFKVLEKKKVGQPVGQKVGQGEKCCPTPSVPVGQEAGCPSVPKPGVGTAGQDSEPIDYDQEISSVIDELGEAQVIVTDVPVEIRREAMRLEDEITEACNAGDETRFRAALHAWRVAWMKSLH